MASKGMFQIICMAILLSFAAAEYYDLTPSLDLSYILNELGDTDGNAGIQSSGKPGDYVYPHGVEAPSGLYPETGGGANFADLYANNAGDVGYGTGSTSDSSQSGNGDSGYSSLYGNNAGDGAHVSGHLPTYTDKLPGTSYSDGPLSHDDGSQSYRDSLPDWQPVEHISPLFHDDEGVPYGQGSNLGGFGINVPGSHYSVDVPHNSGGTRNSYADSNVPHTNQNTQNAYADVNAPYANENTLNVYADSNGPYANDNTRDVYGNVHSGDAHGTNYDSSGLPLLDSVHQPKDTFPALSFPDLPKVPDDLLTGTGDYPNLLGGHVDASAPYANENAKNVYTDTNAPYNNENTQNTYAGSNGPYANDNTQDVHGNVHSGDAHGTNYDSSGLPLLDSVHQPKDTFPALSFPDLSKDPEDLLSGTGGFPSLLGGQGASAGDILPSVHATGQAGHNAGVQAAAPHYDYPVDVYQQRQELTCWPEFFLEYQHDFAGSVWQNVKGNVHVQDGRAVFGGQGHIAIPFFTCNDLLPRYSMSFVISPSYSGGTQAILGNSLYSNKASLLLSLTGNTLTLVVRQRKPNLTPEQLLTGCRYRRRRSVGAVGPYGTASGFDSHAGHSLDDGVVVLELTIGSGEVLVTIAQEDDWIFLAAGDIHTAKYGRLPTLTSEPLYVGAGADPRGGGALGYYAGTFDSFLFEKCPKAH